MSKFRELLKSFERKNEILSIYRYTDKNEEFLLGQIIVVSDDSFIVSNIDIYGNTDGYFFEYLNNISMIEKDSQYITKIKSNNLFEKNVLKNLNTSDLSKSVITFLRTSSKICTIELDHSEIDYTGIFEQEEDGLIYFKQFDKYGNWDGHIIFDIESIINIKWDSKDELFYNIK